ncbi:MAG: LysR family transcriptional regulator [Planctomycetes bacterium]|nr:LysR family transcriptional regulator [Planctomycetota bacterium]
MTDKWMWLNYHHLLYFALVVEEGGIAAAAARLGVSHPTISEQIKRLEAQLKVQLFERRGRRLQLTEDGKLVHDHAKELFGVGAALMEAIEARRLGRNLVARIGVDSVLAKLLVRQILAPMLDATGTDLQFRCVEDEREYLIEKLVTRRLDVVLTDATTELHESSVQTDLLMTSPIAFFAAPILQERLHGAFPACLNDAPLLVPLAMTRLRRDIERWIVDLDLHPRIVGEVADSGLLKALGQDGRGIFAMPSAVAGEIERQYGVTRIGNAENIEARVLAMTTDVSRDNPAIKALLAVRSRPDSMQRKKRSRE